MPGADGRFSSNAPGAIVAGTASPSTTGALDRATASRHPHKHRRRCCANPWDRLVNDQALHPSAEVTAADWLGPRLRRFGSAVAGVVPDRFPAYVRILHPARGPDGLPVRWAEVAAWSGRTMHRLAQFHAIRRPAASAPIGPPSWDGEDPPDGNLPTELLRILCGVLAEHTSTPESCWFCLWDGYGWLYGSPSVGIMGRRGPIAVPPAFPAEVLDGPRVRLPSRDYLLFAGSLAAAPVLGWTDPYGSFFPQSPTCSGRRTTPGALLPRSTCSAPWSPDRRPSPRFSWATRALRYGGSNQQTPSPLTATRSTPR
jgi:hypothetical protein